MERDVWRGALDALTRLIDTSMRQRWQRGRLQLRVKRGTDNFDSRRSGRSWMVTRLRLSVWGVQQSASESNGTGSEGIEWGWEGEFVSHLSRCLWINRVEHCPLVTI
jgi:hypothetical protein